MSELYFWAVNHIGLLRAAVLVLFGITAALSVVFTIAEERENKNNDIMVDRHKGQKEITS